MNTGVLRIAWHESERYVRLFSRRLLLFAALTGVALGGLYPVLREHGVHPDAGIYRAEVDAASPLVPVLRSDPQFEVQVGFHGSFFQGKADLFILGTNVHYNPASEKSRAAAQELERAARLWLERTLEGEPDADAAFPVRVNLVYEARSLATPPSPPPTSPAAPTPSPAGNVSSPSSPGPSPIDDVANAGTGPSQLVEQSGQKSLDLSPHQVNPPFPIRSLLLTFAYLVPLNFVSQFYAGSLHSERIRQRGVLLLSTPFSGAQILLGKSLPYIAVMLALSIAITLSVHATLIGFLAILPVLAFGLSSTLLIGLLARSARELTFLMVTSTVLLSSFLFLPAIFVQLPPVSFLSPMTVVAASIRGDAVALGPFLYATLPLVAAAIVLASLSIALYKEETLFAPRGMLAKLADAIHALMPRPFSLVAAGALLVPFAIGLELYVLIFATSLNLRLAFVVFLIGGAFVEEGLKLLPIHAHQSRAAPYARPSWLVGSLVGLGFFLGEKIALLFGLLGLARLPYGAPALATFGIAHVPWLLLAPLAIHVAAANVSAHFAQPRRRKLIVGWLGAGVLHASYNTALLYLFTRGGFT